MRHLSARRALHSVRRSQEGVTLIELLLALSIVALLVMTAAPSFQDYINNSRLRENGNALYSQMLFAQSEAMKRNNVVRLSVVGGTKLRVTDRSDPANEVLLRETELTAGVNADVATVDFGGEGRPLNFAAAAINLSATGLICSNELRCPGLRVEGGGAIQLCADHSFNCH